MASVSKETETESLARANTSGSELMSFLPNFICASRFIGVCW